MDTLLQDIRYGVRMLFKDPGFTAVAVLTLALGIGANTAMFSVADALLFRPVLLEDLDRLVMVSGTPIDRPQDYDEIAPADFFDWRSQNTTLDHLSAFEWWSVNITGDGEPERVQGFRVSASFFRSLRSNALLGRTFLPEEEEPGRHRVVVLSHGLWIRRFGANPNVLGGTVQLHGQDFQVIGVMPEELRFPAPAELWVPMALSPQERSARGSFSLEAVARLKPGVTVEQAQAEFSILARRLAEQYPESHSKRSARVVPLRERVSGDLTRDYTLMLIGVVGFVLLIACANVANLQFARVSARMREIAVRAALGAGRWRLIRQLLTESVLQGLLGSLFGILLAMWGVDLIRSGMPAEVEMFLPGWKRMGINGLVLACTLGIAVLSGIVAGVVPAFVGSRADLNEGLKEGGRGSSSGVRHHRLRSLLVVFEIVLALVLMAGAGLMVKGFRAGADSFPRLNPERVMTMRITLPESKYPEAYQRAAFQDQILRRLQTIPRTESAALISHLPYSGRRSSSSFAIQGRPAPTPEERPVAQMQSASPDYFRTMRIPLKAGRGFTEHDGVESPGVVIITETLARRYFPGENPLGKRVMGGQPDSASLWLTVVGVVADVRHEWTDRAPRPTLYRPFPQAPPHSFNVAMRTAGDPTSLIAPARTEILGVDHNQPIFDVKTMEKVISDHLVGFRYVAVLMAIFGILSLVLATIGIYSIMAYSVTQRTHELGVRMALGAQPGDVMKLVVRQGMGLILIGVPIGLAAAFVVARVLASLLYGVDATDPTTFVGISLVLAVVAFGACYIPARKATKVDPMVALRYE